MAEPAYVSRVRITRQGGPQRLAYLPATEDPVAFGVHARACPVARSLEGGIEIETRLELT
jgi:hypothetical protein